MYVIGDSYMRDERIDGNLTEDFLMQDEGVEGNVIDDSYMWDERMEGNLTEDSLMQDRGVEGNVYNW